MSGAGEAWVVVGLGFGDEGKGTVVDHLVRSLGARAVLRPGGGPQATHHVVLPDGRWHGFSQFGAGTFVPGVASHLSGAMLVSIPNLLREEAVLRKRGVDDALTRLTIDPTAPLVTPLHTMTGQLLELSRGDARHGSVGIGVGQAVRGLREDGAQAPRLGDARQPERLSAKLKALAERRFAEAEALLRAHPELEERLDYFRRVIQLDELAEVYARFVEAEPQVLVSDADRLAALRAGGGPIVLEGAQGTLLDPSWGFPPYVTKTPSTLAGAESLLADAWPRERVRRLGVLRAYAHRHGAGPLVTADPALAERWAESHNLTNHWQGSFRVGWLDLVATRHAVRANPGLEGLALTHLDRLAAQDAIRVCTAWEHPGPRSALAGFAAAPHVAETFRVTALPAGPLTPEVTQAVSACRPLEWLELPSWPAGKERVARLADLPQGARQLVDLLGSEQGMGVPVRLLSWGPTWRDKLELSAP